MKIGIVTLWDGIDNYGGILQTYALQHYLQELGHDAYIIRYGHRPNAIQKTFSNIKKYIKKCLLYMRIIKVENYKSFIAAEDAKEHAKKRCFNDFRKKNIRLSYEYYHSIAEIQKNPPIADIYITGSDQVWGTDIKASNLEQIRYLNFGDNSISRIAYAVSFGNDFFPCGDIVLFQKLVHRFNKVSVRETSGISICNSLCINSVRCVDSTLLISKETYKSLMSKKKYKENFAFFYTVNITSRDELYWNISLNLCIQKNILPIVTTATGYNYPKEIFDGAIYDYCTVNGWLSNIYYADIVVTASFHGIVFSIIFQKDFIYTPLKSNSKKGNDRITDLLKLVGLMDRTAHNEEEFNILFSQHINFEHINYNKISEMISFSSNFLNLENNG